MKWFFLFSVLLFVIQPTDAKPNVTTALKNGFKFATRFVLDLQALEEEVATGVNPNVSTPFTKVASFLGNTPYIKSVGNTAITQLITLQYAQNRTEASRRQLFKAAKILQKRGGLLQPCSKKRIKSDTPLKPISRVDCCAFPEIVCKKIDDKYRTYDGSCNCKTDPDMGRANRAHARYLPPDYGDGIDSPREAGLGTLPSARRVSLRIFNKAGEMDVKSMLITAMHISVGQVIDHDLTRTSISKWRNSEGDLVDITCGTSKCETTPNENRECFPIPIPPAEPFFTGQPCLKFVRSQAFLAAGCTPGPRRQANVITSWLDSSFIYGSSKEENDKLRDSADPAKMKMKAHPISGCKPLLPSEFDPDCKDAGGSIQCFVAGDGRVNEQIGLAALQTIFVRLHNKFADALRNVNPFWTAETVFQETRRLVGAIWQNIVYSEYLPLVLGSQIMNKYQLYSKCKGCSKGYSCTDYNGDISSVFATAAFRFAHSQAPEKWVLTNADYGRRRTRHLSKVFFRPHVLYNTHFGTTCGVDAILLGHTIQFADKSDRLFSFSVRHNLFSEDTPERKGSDLPALNTQRGRDHGITDYNRWREWCDLSKASDFDEMEDIPNNIRNRLRALYGHIDDVDLFPAAMSERPVPGGIVGPTFACIIARQFRHLKYADRFWFERCNKKHQYSKAQLENIRKYTTGRLLCDTLDKVKKVKKFTMLKTRKEAFKGPGYSLYDAYAKIQAYKGYDNTLQKCKHHPGINFKLWKVKPEKCLYYYCKH